MSLRIVRMVAGFRYYEPHLCYFGRRSTLWSVLLFWISPADPIHQSYLSDYHLQARYDHCQQRDPHPTNPPSSAPQTPADFVPCTPPSSGK